MHSTERDITHISANMLVSSEGILLVTAPRRAKCSDRVSNTPAALQAVTERLRHSHQASTMVGVPSAICAITSSLELGGNVEKVESATLQLANRQVAKTADKIPYNPKPVL